MNHTYTENGLEYVFVGVQLHAQIHVSEVLHGP